jgi:hypothetical protein
MFEVEKSYKDGNGTIHTIFEITEGFGYPILTTRGDVFGPNGEFLLGKESTHDLKPEVIELTDETINETVTISDEDREFKEAVRSKKAWTELAKNEVKNNVTTGDIDADTMLENNKGTLDTVLLCGRAKDGTFIYASSIGDTGEILVLLELYRNKLMQNVT